MMHEVGGHIGRACEANMTPDRVHHKSQYSAIFGLLYTRLTLSLVSQTFCSTGLVVSTVESDSNMYKILGEKKKIKKINFFLGLRKTYLKRHRKVLILIYFIFVTRFFCHSA
jgi:hypothetical protein